MGRAENEVASYLIRRCRDLDIVCEKVHNEGETGCPDYILTFPNGKIERVETKSKRGTCSPKQVWYQRRLARNGCWVFVPRSTVDIDTFINGRRLAGYCNRV